MSIFSNSIGQMMTNEEDDVFKAKEIFQDIGLYKDDPENGILDQGLDDALKIFQKDRGLKIDGILHPDGETEQVLTRELVQKQKKEKEPLNGIIPPQRKPKNPLLVLKETLEKSRPNSQKKSPLETLLGNLETLSPPDVIKNVQEKQTPKPEEKPAPVDATGRMIREKEDNKFDELKDKLIKKATQLGIDMLPDEKVEKTDQFWKHYVEGSGESVKLNSKEMQKSKIFQKAIKTNQKRFEESMVKGKVAGKPHVFQDQILELKEGETTLLKKGDRQDGKSDHWDRDIGAFEGLIKGDVDQTLSTGHVKMKSEGTLRATRKGDTVLIEGTVDNSIKDVYDFNKDDTMFKAQRHLHNTGHAKPFVIEGSQTQKVQGKITIQNGVIKESKFKWDHAD